MMGRREAIGRCELKGRRIDRCECFTGLRAGGTCTCTDVRYEGRRESQWGGMSLWAGHAPMIRRRPW